MRSENIKSVGKRLDANLLDSENGIDKYFTSEQEKTDVTGLVGTAQSTATAAQATASAAQTSANTAQATASAAQTSANTAQATASAAVSNAANAQNTASSALSGAAMANSRLAGDGDIYKGTFPIATAIVQVTPTLTQVLSQGITWDVANQKFNFSYLGWYVIEVKTGGDINNVRTDWYQEFMVSLLQNNIQVNDVTVTIPPSITKNLRVQASFLIKVESGDAIKIRYGHVSGGTVQAGASGVVTIKKVI